MKSRLNYRDWTLLGFSKGCVQQICNFHQHQQQSISSPSYIMYGVTMANLQGKGLCCFLHFPTYQFVSHIYYLVLHSPHFTFVHNARPIKQFTRYIVYLAVNQASSQNILFLSYSQQHKSSILWNVIIPSSKRQLIPPSCIEDATTIKRRRRRRNTNISRISHKSVDTKRVDKVLSRRC